MLGIRIKFWKKKNWLSAFHTMDAVEEKKDAIQDGDYAIGCVMCATNFAWNDEQTIVTTCGHLYHQNCLEKWFQSLDV